MIRSHEAEIMAALKKDLNKNDLKLICLRLEFCLEEICFALKNLKKWSKPQKVKSALAQVGSKRYIYPEPYGVALIISPWNYPIQLTFAPLIGAIAAGNCAVLKPSK